MTSHPLLLNIEKSQQDYYSMIIKYKDKLSSQNISVKDIACIIDEIKLFWLERKEILDFELEELTEENTCFLLSGAIYLDVSDYEHYYLKSLGDYHLLFDPFLKMENFFRISEGKTQNNDFGYIDYFKKVYSDAIKILKNFKNHFYILPINEIAIQDVNSHREMLNKFFFIFLSSALDHDIYNEEEFHQKYKTFEDIEKSMNQNFSGKLIFNDPGDFSLSLKDRIEKYIKSQRSLIFIMQNKTESERFFIALYSYVTQIMDILLICTMLRVFPFIRFDVTFYYLTLIMYTFVEDSNLKKLIEHAIISFVFHKAIEKERFKNIKFDDYLYLLNQKSLLAAIFENVHEKDLEIINSGIGEIGKIIRAEMNNLLDN